MIDSIVNFVCTVYYSWYNCIMYRFEDDPFCRRCFWEELNWGWHEMYGGPSTLCDNPTFEEVYRFFFPGEI